MKEYIHLYLQEDHTVLDAVETNTIVGAWDQNSSGQIHVFINENSRRNMIHQLEDQNNPLQKPDGTTNLIAKAIISGDKAKAKELGATDEQIERWTSMVRDS